MRAAAGQADLLGRAARPSRCTSWLSETPRRAASVHITGSDSCTDAMPPQARPKSPTSLRLSADRAGRVVGDDEVDDAVEQRLPELVAVGRVADRRAALELRCAVRDLLGLEGQVVRAGLDRQRQTLGLGRGHLGQRGRGRQVHDVGPAAGLAASPGADGRWR